MPEEGAVKARCLLVPLALLALVFNAADCDVADVGERVIETARMSPALCTRCADTGPCRCEPRLPAHRRLAGIDPDGWRGNHS